jgi:hypothetical protein
VKLIYRGLPEDTTIRCAYVFYSGYCTGAAVSCDKKAEYILTDEDGQETILAYCKEHMHTEWIDRFIAAGQGVEKCG